MYDLLHAYGDGSFVVSDRDQELLILMEFDREVTVNAVTFHAQSWTIQSNRNFNISQPRRVCIFKTKDASLNFSDINRMTADVSGECDAVLLERGHKVMCSLFNVRNLAIFVQTNQAGTVRSFLNAIVMEGSVQQTQIEYVIVSDVK